MKDPVDESAWIGETEFVIRFACPRWQEDGPWPPPWEKACTHLRADVGLPLEINTLVRLADVLTTCRCGERVLILSCTAARPEKEG